ncbi:hypothetical protein [Niabella hibiscisoli]|uniref:hypothetical protein n=1 Tax=Niabella hibiscisoli TaxID=1825928 RepID=UPI001F0EEB37|nr:hypothetical protein [Niabella hibiscisoli]MCH5719093.1 hypothetical protein [Niabella hibiscisoli]
MGIFTGELLRNNRYAMKGKTACLLVAGILSLIVGMAWGTVFPVNKNMWTSSFVLYAGGWSLLLFALFYFVIDVKGIKKWSWPFVWLGCNSILIYLAAHGLVNFLSTSGFLMEGIVKRTDARWHDAILWLGVALIQFAALYGLYKRKIFLKI